MPVIVVRHGLSEANNRNNVGNLAFASETAPLMELGRQQARALRPMLNDEYSINPSATPAATSELLRTQQTAQEAGFLTLKAYSCLDEVKHGMELTSLRAILDEGMLPSIALQSAEAVLNNPPPEESIWFTHGLLIAGLCAALGVHQDRRLIPRFCEARELPIP